MKKLLLFVCLAVLSTGAFAQASFNVKAGMNLSNYITDANTKVKVGFKAGVGMEYSFNELISLQPSLLVASKGAKGDIFSFGSSSLETTINQVYIELPIMVGFRFNISGNTNVVLSVGPYFAYGVGGKTTLSGNLGGFTGNSSWNTFNSDNGLKAFDFGAGVGVAFEFGGFFVGLDSEFGFLDIAKDSWFGPKANNISVGIGAGYRF